MNVIVTRYGTKSFRGMLSRRMCLKHRHSGITDMLHMIALGNPQKNAEEI